MQLVKFLIQLKKIDKIVKIQKDQGLEEMREDGYVIDVILIVIIFKMNHVQDVNILEIQMFKLSPLSRDGNVVAEVQKIFPKARNVINVTNQNLLMLNITVPIIGNAKFVIFIETTQVLSVLDVKSQEKIERIMKILTIISDEEIMFLEIKKKKNGLVQIALQ